MNNPAPNYTTLHGNTLVKCEKTINKHIGRTKNVLFWLDVIRAARDNPFARTPLLKQLPKELMNLEALASSHKEDAWKLLNHSSVAELEELKKMRDKLNEGEYLNRSEFMSALDDIITLYTIREEELLKESS